MNRFTERFPADVTTKRGAVPNSPSGSPSTRHSAAPVRRVSIHHVAKAAGVSVGTVSNVMNNPVLVSDSTRSRVEASIVELGFVRNGSARQLRAGTSQAVGAVVLDIANPFFTDVARGIEDRLSQDGCVLMLSSTDEKPEREERNLRLLEEQGVRGVLLTPSRGDLVVLREIRDRGMAVVLLDAPGEEDICAAGVDDVHGGRIAAKHLFDLGHRRIAFANGPLSIRQCADRRRGVVRAIRNARLRLADTLIEVTTTLNAAGGEAAVERLLSTGDPPTAIMCANDLTAMGVLRALHRRQIRVPEDISVVGYDDLDVVSILATPLTTVRQPRYALGWQAADLLLDETGGRSHRHRQVRFEPELIVRESTSRSRRR